MLAYRYRLYPTIEQAETLGQWCGCARAVYNAGLEQRRVAYLDGLAEGGAVVDSDGQALGVCHCASEELSSPRSWSADATTRASRAAQAARSAQAAQAAQAV